jgi:hypothetical protein
MFEFFKKFFRKETEKIIVKIADLDTWFDDKTKDYASELKEYTTSTDRHLDKIKEELREAINELEEEKIQDEEKIVPKIKSLVIAARADFIRNIRHLIDELVIDTSSEDAMLESCKKMQERLDIFAKRTIKEYYKTQHLFHKPLERIAADLKELGKTANDMNEHISKSNVFKAREIKQLTKNLHSDMMLSGDMKKSLAEFEGQIKEKESEIDGLKKQISELEGSEEYTEYQKDINRLNRLKEELGRKGNEIYQLLAPLQAGLKRYLRVALENIETLSMYVNDPVKALMNDEELIILVVLDKLKYMVERGELDIKEDKKKKMASLITSITREGLEELRQAYKNLEKGTEEVRLIIERNEAQKRKEELLQKEGKAEQEMETAQRELNQAKEKINKVDIERDKKEIIERISSLLNTEVLLE